MPRIDDYRKAVELGKKDLKDKNPKRIADLSGADFVVDSEGKVVIILNFLNRDVVITWPDLRFSYAGSDEELPVQQQVLLLHYLHGSKGSKILDKLIAYQEVPDGKFYLDAFVRRAKNPLVQAFGNRPELLQNVAMEAYGAAPDEHGDASVRVQALPGVPVVLILWRGDEDFPPDGNILFDKSISEILSAEDIAWLAGMVIYPLVGMAGKG